MISTGLFFFIILFFIQLSGTHADGCPKICRSGQERTKLRCRRATAALTDPTKKCALIRCASGDNSPRYGCKLTNTNPAASRKPSPDDLCPKVCRLRRDGVQSKCRKATAALSDPSKKCALYPCVVKEGNPGFTCKLTKRAPSPTICSSSTPISTPSTTPSMTPSTTPCASSMASPSPVSFKEATFQAGVSSSRTSVAEAIDGSDDQFDVSYNVKLRADGVVSLAGISNFIRSITCSVRGEIRVKLKGESIVEDSVEDMYPVDAVIFVDRSIFGECRLSRGGRPRSRDGRIRQTTSQAALFDDTYAVITSVSGNPRDAVLQVQETSFFSMFDEGQISITRRDLPTASRRSTNIILTDDLATYDDNNTALTPLSRDITVMVGAKVFKFGPLKVTATGTIKDSGGFESFTARWGLLRTTVELNLITEYQASLELALIFKVGATIDLFEEELLSIPLYGIPPIKILGLEPEDSMWVPPSIKLGVYLEVPLIGDLSMNLEKKLSTLAKFSYKTARYRTTMFMRGFILSPRFGRSIKKLAPPQRTFQYTPTFESEDPVTVDVTLFVGVRPQLAAYAIFFFARLSVDAGLQIKAEAKFLGRTAFSPIKTGLRLGVCETCHHLQIKGQGVVQNAGFFAGSTIGSEDPTSVKLPGDPSFTIDLLTACFFKQFDDEQNVVCGENCCNKEDNELCEMSGSSKTCKPCPSDMPILNPTSMMCEGSPTPEPTGTATPTPTPEPTETASPTPTPGVDCSVYTDPHLRTFDGLSFDCQAIGEFILVSSALEDFEVQARFQGPNIRGTVTKGVAVRHKGAIAQVSIAVDASSPSIEIGGCPVLFYVNRSIRNISSGSGIREISVTSSGTELIISLMNGVSVSFRTRQSSTFGCYLEFLAPFIPGSVVQSGDIVGLLGSPNNNPYDDWMARNGTALPAPSTTAERLFQPAYEYCTKNWCIRSKRSSLFTYENSTGFADFNECDTPYGSPPDFSSASRQLRNLCGDDEACLVDGLSGNMEDARVALNAQARVDERRSRQSDFSFVPATIATGSTVNVVVTLDMRRIAPKLLRGLEHFSLFSLDENTGSLSSTVLLQLNDDGSAMSSDRMANDSIYTNVIAQRSSTAGERFSFRAIPTINGVLDDSSPLVRTGLRAIRSYSEESGIGTSGSNSSTATVDSLTGLELVVLYSWPTGRSDLDTSTRFLRENVGYNCSGRASRYVTWSGDDTSSGGTETAFVQLAKARTDGAWHDTTTVSFFAGWHENPQGPATLRLVLREESTGIEIPRTRLSKAIDPGVQSRCASTPVGVLTVSVGARVRLNLSD